MQKSWWKEAIVYQIYPRSFKDSNADGIGDLRGIISKLDYLRDLGVDVIWLSPHFKSPNVDNGYDISDYEVIMSDFGTMSDFDEMLAKIHQNGMKLIIDLVVNHSSDEHFWFQEALKGKKNPYRDYYIWNASDTTPNDIRNVSNSNLTPNPLSKRERAFRGVESPLSSGEGVGGEVNFITFRTTPPNDWISFFSGSAWEFDELSQEYYLHYFVKKQPDLNWENPKLRQEIYKMMDFWLEKGVNGFRMDVISLISKDQNFPNFPENRLGDLSYYANGPRVHEFLQEMNHEVLSKYDCMTVGEAFGVSAQQANDYVGKERSELNMIYHFDHAVPRDEVCFVQPKPEFKLSELKAIFRKWDEAIGDNGWNTVYFGNHDNARMLSRFGDTGIYHQESAKLLATILLTLRGTPYLYQGDEIGMYNCTFSDISEFNDVQVLNAYKTLVENGKYSDKQFLDASNKIARDHARTPIQWNAERNAGFSDAPKTWLKINDNYLSINVLDQNSDENSILNFYKKLIQIRKQTPALIYGTYQDLRPRCNRIWLYLRTFEKNSYLIMNNFTNKKQDFEVKQKLMQKELILANVVVENDESNQNFILKPYESRIYRIEQFLT